MNESNGGLSEEFWVVFMGHPYFVESFVFSGGEVHVRLPQDLIDLLWDESSALFGDAEVTAAIRNSADFMRLINTLDALRRVRRDLKIGVFIPYLPYGRQDRVCNQGESFSLRVFANILNSYDLLRVISLDAHSDKTWDEIRNFVNIPKELIIKRSDVGQEMIESADVLIAPDAGAADEVSRLAEKFNKPYVQAHKTRDVLTREITGIDLVTDSETPDFELSGKKCLVLDDICDGGRTFMELAKVLTAPMSGEGPISELNLYVTHGIFSRGIEELSQFYSNIYVANNINNTKEVIEL